MKSIIIVSLILLLFCGNAVAEFNVTWTPIKESIIDKIASYQIEELVILESIVDKYENNKECFLKYAESDFLRLN